MGSDQLKEKLKSVNGISKDVIEQKSLPMIRLTKEEYEKIFSGGVNSIFTHVNLQHSDVDESADSMKYQIGATIVTNGLWGDNYVIPPKLDMSRVILLEKLESRFSLKVSSPLQHDNLILHNGKGMLDSLYDKYSKVRGLSREEIKKMKYFYRKFKVLGFIDLTIATV